MRTEPPAWAPPLMAVQFLTRVPVSVLARLDGDQARLALGRAAGWLPLVGALIGCVTAAVFAGASLIWSPLIAAFIALVAEALLTGAFHEDAVADFCDAFGGSASGEEAHRILKDSRIGSYGALGLILLVGLRVAVIAALPAAHAALAIICAAATGRSVAVALMAMLPPASTGRGLAKDIGGIPARVVRTAVFTSLPALIVAAFVFPAALAATLLSTALLVIWLTRFLRRRIGGSTGDCLGFAAFLGQLLLLVFVAAG